MSRLVKPNQANPGITPDAPTSDYEIFAARIKLDRNALDVAAEEQAQIFLEVAQQHVLACSRRDEAKDDIARIDASLARDFRAQCEEQKIRATEALISDHVLQHQSHISAAATLRLHRIEADQWGALREAFDQRMRMIKELVGLYASGYYSEGGTIGPRNAIRDAIAENARQKLDEGRKARQGKAADG
jgi:hypothetical protein